MRHYPGLLLALALALGCSGGTTDESNGPTHVPQLGRYHFTTSWPIEGSATPAAASGTLTITSAVGDNIGYSVRAR